VTHPLHRTYSYGGQKGFWLCVGEDSPSRVVLSVPPLFGEKKRVFFFAPFFVFKLNTPNNNTPHIIFLPLLLEKKKNKTKKNITYF